MKYACAIRYDVGLHCALASRSARAECRTRQYSSRAERDSCGAEQRRVCLPSPPVKRTDKFTLPQSPSCDASGVFLLAIQSRLSISERPPGSDQRFRDVCSGERACSADDRFSARRIRATSNGIISDKHLKVPSRFHPAIPSLSFLIQAELIHFRRVNTDQIDGHDADDDGVTVPHLGRPFYLKSHEFAGHRNGNERKNCCYCWL